MSFASTYEDEATAIGPTSRLGQRELQGGPRTEPLGKTPHYKEDKTRRILIVDSFAPQMAPAAHRLAWQRGYEVIVNGGGTSGIMQRNDTAFAPGSPVRRDAPRLSGASHRLDGAGVERPTPQKQARDGCWKRGHNKALDGRQVHILEREANVLFRELAIAQNLMYHGACQGHCDGRPVIGSRPWHARSAPVQRPCNARGTLVARPW